VLLVLSVDGAVSATLEVRRSFWAGREATRRGATSHGERTRW